MDIFRNKQWWSTLSESDLSKYIDDIFNHYRKSGYPYYSINVNEELKKLQKSGNTKMEGKIIKQKMAGLALAWNYHPHAVEVRNGKSLSPLEVFNDDALFRKCIEKRIRYGDNISDAAIRKSLRKYGGLGVSNFRPTSASFIYDYFNAEKVWDMSAGYGGRMLGSWLSKSVKHYICTEPCTKTYKGLLNMKKDLQSNPNNKSLKIDIHQIGSEDFLSENVDLCFTSPPYFNQERYSDEPTQSYIKFPTYSEWVNGYLRLTIENCKKSLKPTGKLAVNIANTKNNPTLEQDFLRVCQEVGFTLEDTLYLELSAREHYSVDKSFKYEPVFILNICKR